MLGDFGKELPEDTHLVDLLDPEILGLSAPPDRASFREIMLFIGKQ